MKKKINLNEINYNKPFINREYIKKHLTSYQIYSKYIDYNFKINEVFKSPFRNDKTPSFGIFKGSDGDLIYNDFALGGGDVFVFIKYLFSYKTWWETYSRIGIDFGLNDKYICKSTLKKLNNLKHIKKKYSPEEFIKKLDIKVKITNWTFNDKKYWTQYGITLSILKKYNVFPISYIFLKNINKQNIIKCDSLAYCYIENKDNIKTYKIYQPYSKYKWLNNHNLSVWQGWNQLPLKDNILIITKSLKDVMSINSICNIPSISLQSEKTKPKIHIINELKKRFDDIYILYDNDFNKKINYGQIFSKKLCNEFNFKNLVIPTKYKCKDFSDLVKKKGINKANKILKKLIKYYEKMEKSKYPF